MSQYWVVRSMHLVCLPDRTFTSFNLTQTSQPDLIKRWEHIFGLDVGSNIVSASYLNGFFPNIRPVNFRYGFDSKEVSIAVF